MKKIHEDLDNRLQNTHRFCNGDLHEFCLMFCEGVYPYEYMDSWQRFSETLLSDKKEFDLTIKTLQMLTTCTRKEFGKISEYKT